MKTATAPRPGDSVRIHAESADGRHVPIGYGWLVLPRHPLIQRMPEGDRVPVILDSQPPIGTWVAPRLLERMNERPRRGVEVQARYPHFAIGPAHKLVRPGFQKMAAARELRVQRERLTACGEYHPADGVALSPVSSMVQLVEIPYVTDTPDDIRCGHCRRAIGLPEKVRA
jgi:hypothetical protein